MKNTKTSRILGATLAAAAMAASPVAAQDGETPTEMSKGEAKLAKMLEGRVAGEADNCIRTSPSRNLTIIDGTALVYRQGSTIWVNRTKHPESLDDSDALLIRKFGSGTRLCRTDTVTTFDPFVGFYTGNVFLTDFVPYRMADS